MRVALSIAGSDSSAGAGVQADLKTFAAHGVYGTCAITAVTAQTTRGVTMVELLPVEIVRAQIEAAVSDVGVHAAKTGMLGTAAIVDAVAALVHDHAIPFLVVDPVVVAKSGDHLLETDALDTLRSELLRVTYVVTPNIPEAEMLTGMGIHSDADQREAARRLVAFGARAAIVKGGHLPSNDIVDLLYDGHEFVAFRQERVPGPPTHGTGCTFAAALTAHLAQGRTLREAVPLVQRYVAGAIRHAPALGGGHGLMDHFWTSRPDKGAKA